jgi:hypothetical protein
MKYHTASRHCAGERFCIAKIARHHFGIQLAEPAARSH